MSSVCSGRWLWTNSVQRSGSRPEGEEAGGHLARPPAHDVRVVGARQRVVVDDAVDRLVLVLEHHVVADRAEVVAEVDDPGRLDAGEDPLARAGRLGGRGSGREFDGHRPPSVAGPDRPSARPPRAAFATIAPHTDPRREQPHREHPAPARRRARRRHRRPRGRPRVPRAVRRACRPPTARRSCWPRSAREVHRARDRVGDPGRAADRRAGPPRRERGRGRHRRADGRRRAGPHAHRGGARRRQERRDREQARRRPPRPGARGGSPARPGAAFRFEAAVGGGIPLLGPLAQDLAANRITRVRGHRQRHDELHPHRDDPRGPRLRRGPRRGPGQRATRRPTRPATSRGSTRSTSS